MAFTACKKKDKDDPNTSGNPTASTGAFELHLHTNIDTNEVDSYNTVYTDAVGRKMTLSLAQMYISEIQLVKTDGSLVDLSGTKILKVLEVESYIAGNAPAGNYKSIRFKVGLDATTNAESPTTPADSALLNKPQMWLGATAQPDGYVFMNLQGTIDTTANLSGTLAQMQPFVYKIGTNANYKQVTMPDKNFSILPNDIAFGHITIDYSLIFANIVLSQPANLSVTSAAANSTAPGTIVANAIPSMFRYEE